MTAFTPEQLRRIDTMNAEFVAKLQDTPRGRIKNEDSFEKTGLAAKLRESPEFFEEYCVRAEQKVAGQRPE